MHGYFRDCDSRSSFLFLNDTTSTKLYTLSLHDALPILLTSRSSPADVGEPRPVGQPSGGSDMRIRFWWTRGSLATPGPTTLRYSGNTSCVEVRTADGTLIVLDCGTGAHGLGRALAASGERPVRGHLLITHAHW